MRERLRPAEIGLILVLAALPRLFGLGHVSLWLDEVLSSLRVDLGFGDALAAWRDNRVHPPLSEILQWLWFRTVESEPLRRLLPVALGIATICLLALLCCRWFGRRTAWATALLAALSPLHIRYSQELRAYSLALFAVVLALLAAEHAAQRGNPAAWLRLGAALALCLWSLYFAALVLVPAAILLWPGGEALRPRLRHLGGPLGSLVLALALFSPWLPIVLSNAGHPNPAAATEWNLPLFAQRWQFLSVGGVEGRALTAGAIGMAAMILVGALRSLSLARPRPGRALLAGAICGTLGVEALLRSADHWSSPRYNLVAWPFLIALAGLGSASLAGWIGRVVAVAATARPAHTLRRAGAALAWAPLAALLLFETVGSIEYFRQGRPDWQQVARAVAELGAADRPILVDSESTRVPLGYYLAQLEGSPRATISSRLTVADLDRDEHAPPPPACSVLVHARSPSARVVDRAELATPIQARFPRTGARVAVSPGAGERAADPWLCLPAGADLRITERPPPELLRRSDLLLESRTARSARQGHPGDIRAAPIFGWSALEIRQDGAPFRWALGLWAAVEFSGPPAGSPVESGRSLLVAGYSLDDAQTVDIYHGRDHLGQFALPRDRVAMEIALPADFGISGPERLTFGFGRFESLSTDSRPLAVCFERLELVR